MPKRCLSNSVMVSPKRSKQDSDSESEELVDDSPCPVCDTLSSYRRVVRIPKSGETYMDKDCGYCGAIIRYFTKYMTFEELDEKYIENQCIKVVEVDEQEHGDQLKIVFKRVPGKIGKKLYFK